MSSPAQPAPIYDFPVLVIDDDNSICTMLVETLTMEGYSAAKAVIPFDRTAEVAGAALQSLLHATRPSIILTDPTTYGITGTEDLYDYLQDPARRQPHLLYLMTALIEADAARAMNWLHADGCFSMPFAIDELLARLDDIEHDLRNRTATPPDPFTIDL